MKVVVTLADKAKTVKTYEGDLVTWSSKLDASLTITSNGEAIALFAPGTWSYVESEDQKA